VPAADDDDHFLLRRFAVFRFARFVLPRTISAPFERYNSWILLRELRVCGEVVRSIADRNHSQLALITIYLQMRSIYLVVRDFAEKGRATDLLVAPLRVFVSFVIFVLR
jgi:hypothetical protein